LGIGDWGLGPIPNPQSPIPNPQSPNFNKPMKSYSFFLFLYKNYNNLKIKLKKNEK